MVGEQLPTPVSLHEGSVAETVSQLVDGHDGPLSCQAAHYNIAGICGGFGESVALLKLLGLHGKGPLDIWNCRISASQVRAVVR